MTTTQAELFAGSDTGEAPASRFAEIVFNRPLDHAYTYAVPAELVDVVEVGKRVRAPFGQGNRSTVGFCVGLSEETPKRAVKALSKSSTPSRWSRRR